MFALRVKIVTPIGIVGENVSTLAIDLKRNRSQKLIPAWVKTFFYFCFGYHLISDAKPFQFQTKTV